MVFGVWSGGQIGFIGTFDERFQAIWLGVHEPRVPKAQTGDGAGVGDGGL